MKTVFSNAGIQSLLRTLRPRRRQWPDLGGSRTAALAVVADAASRKMRFAYELRDSSGERLHATGSSSHVWVDRETRRPVIADADVMKAFEPWLHPLPSEEA